MEPERNLRLRGFRGLWVLAGILALAAGAGVGGWQWWRAQQAPKKTALPAQPELPPGAEIQLTGVVRASNLIPVDAPLDGVMEEVPVKIGDEVYEGQILGRIKNDSLDQAGKQADLEFERAEEKLQGLESSLIAARLEDSRADADAARARSDFGRAQRGFERQQLLWREGATPRKSYETAEKSLEATKRESETLDAVAKSMRERIAALIAEIESARKNLAEMEKSRDKAKEDLNAALILSPSDGLVVSIKKSAGEEVQKGTKALFEVAADLTVLELHIEADPKTIPRVKAGDSAVLQIAEVAGEGLPAKVKSVGDGKIVVEFSSPTTLIRPGMTAVARLKLT